MSKNVQVSCRTVGKKSKFPKRLFSKDKKTSKYKLVSSSEKKSKSKRRRLCEELSNSKYKSLRVVDLKDELRNRQLGLGGNRKDLLKRLDEDDVNKNTDWNKMPENMGGYNEEETPYAGPTIHEIIRIGDHLLFGYCDYENHSRESYITKEVIKVEADEGGTGHRGSVVVRVKNYPFPIPATTQVQRVKYINDMGALVDVPDGEGARGYVEEFEKLITGEQQRGLKKIIEQQAEVNKQSLIEILDKMSKNIRESTGVTVDMVISTVKNNNTSTLNGCQETDEGK